METHEIMVAAPSNSEPFYKEFKFSRDIKETSLEVSFNTPSYDTSSSSHPSYNYFAFSSFLTLSRNQHEQLHSKILQIITQRKILGYKVRLKHFKTLVISFTIDDFIHYTKTEDFNSLNENHKRLMRLLIHEMLSKRKDKSYRNFDPLNESYSSRKYCNNQIHAQIQQIVKKSIGQSIILTEKEFKTFANSFTIDDIIQYTKMTNFNSLDRNHKEFVHRQIDVKLVEEFQGQDITLSQNLDEYVKRGIIPSLPFGINSYDEYENTDWFNTISEIQKSRVRKLILLEYKLNPRRLKKINFDFRVTKRSGLVVVCADDVYYNEN